MLSDADKLKKVPSSRRRSVNAATNKFWSDSQKIEAVTTYLALGNLVLTSNVLKIPEMTLRGWKQTAWWKEIAEDLALQEDLQLSSRLQKIIESTISATEDRIKNGDWIYNNREGTLIRKPVNLRDVHKVTMDFIDKREHLINKTPNNVALEAVDERLKKLAEKFEQIANARNVVQVTDVIVGEVYDSSDPAP